MLRQRRHLGLLIRRRFETIVEGMKNLTPIIDFSVTGDVARILTKQADSLISFTEEGAKAFAEEAAMNMREHIANFSVMTVAGRPHIAGQEFESYTGEKIAGGGLYGSIGSAVFKDAQGQPHGIAGVGIGGKPIPRNVSGDGYAMFVDRGTNPSEGRFVPKVQDIELWDIRDPTRRIKYHGIPSTWVPKFSKGHSEMAESWWAARKKRALVKKRVRKSLGRYMQSADPTMLTLPFEGERKAFRTYYPKYPVTSLGIRPPGKGYRIGLPFGGQDVYFGRSRLRRRAGPEVYRVPQSIADISRAMKEELEELKMMDAETLNETRLKNLAESSYEVWRDYAASFGGALRGYGGKGNILRSAGDIAYAVFSLDVRMATHILGAGNMAMLEGYPDNVGVKLGEEKGLGLRLNNSTGNVRGGDIGEHPGTPARNFILNTAKHMKGWLRNVLLAGGIITKGKQKGLRVTNQLGEF